MVTPAGGLGFTRQWASTNTEKDWEKVLLRRIYAQRLPAISSQPPYTCEKVRIKRDFASCLEDIEIDWGAARSFVRCGICLGYLIWPC